MPWQKARLGFFATLPTVRPAARAIKHGDGSYNDGCALCVEAFDKATRKAEQNLMAALDPPTRVRIPWKVQRALREEAARAGNSVEVGGFLFGTIEHELLVGTRVTIREFSNRRTDERSRDHLVMSLDHQDRAIRGELSKWDYLGDWHTHPGGVVLPSNTDVEFWRSAANQVSWQPGRAPGYIGLLLGAEAELTWNSYWIHMRAWFVPPKRWDVPEAELEPRELSIVEAMNV